MAKQDFTFGFADSPLEDDAGNIVIAGDPPHVVIPIQPIPIVHIHARNMHWRYLYGVLKITVNGVEREFHYTEGHTDSSMPADLGTIYIEEWDDGYAGWTINFKAFTINKSVQICQLSVSIETECDGLSTHPIQWEVSSFNASPPHLKDVYACIGYDIHLMDMQIDTQSRTGWFEIYEGVSPDKTCKCGDDDDDDDDDDDELNLPETIYVTGNWRVITTDSDGATYEEGGQLTPYSATLKELGNGEYIYEGTNIDDYVFGRDNGKTWIVSSSDCPHLDVCYPTVTKSSDKSSGPEGTYEHSVSVVDDFGITKDISFQFTVSALGVDEMFE